MCVCVSVHVMEKCGGWREVGVLVSLKKRDSQNWNDLPPEETSLWLSPSLSVSLFVSQALFFFFISFTWTKRAFQSRGFLYNQFQNYKRLNSPDTAAAFLPVLSRKQGTRRSLGLQRSTEKDTCKQIQTYESTQSRYNMQSSTIPNFGCVCTYWNPSRCFPVQLPLINTVLPEKHAGYYMETIIS